MADSLNSVLKKMQKKYGDSVVKVGADSLEVDGMLSLGSPMVDYMLYGGLPEGRIIKLSGAEGSGKTTTSFLIAASYQKAELERHPVGMEWEDNTRQLHEGPRGIIFLDNEGTLDPVWASVFGYDLSEYAKVPTYVIRPEGQNAEQIFDMALDLLKTGEIGLMIFDSIATLVPAQIAEESQEKYQMGGIAKAEDAIEFMLAGASAVAVGTANFVQPDIAESIAHGMLAYLDRHNAQSINDIVGLALPNGKASMPYFNK